MTSFQGEIAALSAACLWAIASVVYGRLGERIPPVQLNFMKGIVAIALLLLTIVLSGELFPNIPPTPLCLILLSGVVGIGLGDTVFFASINTLGPRRALLMGTLAPPITAIGAMIFLQEKLNLSAWCGILLTILGVAWVVTERTPEDGGDGGRVSGSAMRLWWGIGFGVLAAIANAMGALFSRAAFSNANVSPLWAALLRLSAGVLILLLWGLFFQPKNRTIPYSDWRSARLIPAIIFAAFCGTYLGIWLQQIALKFTVAGIASTLLQTSPVFIIPIGIWLGEKVSWRAIAGVMIAIAGIGLLFYLN
ncbi:DMT family transporter [Pelatocladus sp. BLCC-F211]|uniref:DMT family transporter n=1 Tax=Pelatocladus sp. BLCC-F211 TaxID=3342752 RepID=UPI0035BB7BD1